MRQFNADFARRQKDNIADGIGILTLNFGRWQVIAQAAAMTFARAVVVLVLRRLVAAGDVVAKLAVMVGGVTGCQRATIIVPNVAPAAAPEGMCP